MRGNPSREYHVYSAWESFPHTRGRDDLLERCDLARESILEC